MANDRCWRCCKLAWPSIVGNSFIEDEETPLTAANNTNSDAKWKRNGHDFHLHRPVYYLFPHCGYYLIPSVPLLLLSIPAVLLLRWANNDCTAGCHLYHRAGTWFGAITHLLQHSTCKQIKNVEWRSARGLKKCDQCLWRNVLLDGHDKWMTVDRSRWGW